MNETEDLYVVHAAPTESESEHWQAIREPVYDLIAHLRRQRVFSLDKFGPGTRVRGVIDHIKEELEEIEEHPGDVVEWIDVALLAFDGAWRAGFEPEEIAAAFEAKLTKNENRTWPDWRTADLDRAIKHVRRADRGDV